ncbi:MAG: PhnD/SsuA/transferrin family substrate-binding protein, partial [Paracoccaceae bacterium]
MKKLLAAIVATTALTAPAFAEDIKEFRIGILGGENAQDRLNNNECLREYTEETLGDPAKLFAPADYNGGIQGLLVGTIDMAGLGASGYAKTFLRDPEAVEPVLGKVILDGGNGSYEVGFARVAT